MRFLLDTHVLLWLAGEPERIPQHVRSAIADAKESCVSLASAWEYGSKRAKFPDRLPKPFEQLLADDYRRLDFPFRLHHFSEQLPLVHSDPFDRMLVAQAIDLELTLVSADEVVRRYPVATIW